MIGEGGFDLFYQQSLVGFLDDEISSKSDFRPEVHALEGDPALLATEGPLPMNEIVRIVLSKKILQTIRRAESSTQVAIQVARRNLVAQD